MINARKLLDTWELMGSQPLPHSFARQLLTLPKEQSLDDWFRWLPEHAADRDEAERLVGRLRECVEAAELTSAAPAKRKLRPSPPESLTFAATASRAFEKSYWNTIANLSTGRYVNKDNADCVLDSATQAQTNQPPAATLRRWAIICWRTTGGSSMPRDMTGRATVGELPFRWQTDFHFSWWGGWLKNQQNERASATWSWSFPAAIAAAPSSWPITTTPPTWKTSTATPAEAAGRAWRPPAPTTTTRPRPRLMLAAADLPGS